MHSSGSGNPGGAAVGYDNSGWASQSQTISTIIGVEYDISYDFRASHVTGNEMGCSVGGVSDTVWAAVSPAWQTLPGSLTATSTSTTFSLNFATDPGTGVLYIDNASVMGENTVEASKPGTLVVLGLGLLGLRLTKRARRAKGRRPLTRPLTEA